MARRSVLWGVGAAIYAVVNIGGAAYALAMGEMAHAGLHVVLLIVGAAVWSRYRPARTAGATTFDDPHDGGSSTELTDRFRNLEQSIDAVAIEVERIGEGQRFMTNLLVDQEGSPAPAESERDRSRS